MVFAEPLQEFLVGEGPKHFVVFQVGDFAVLETVLIIVPGHQHDLSVVSAHAGQVGAFADNGQRLNVFGTQVLCLFASGIVLFAVKRVEVHEGYHASLGIDHVAVRNVRVAGGHFVLFEVFAQKVIVVGEQVVVFQERNHDLAESLVRNLYCVRERFLAVVGGVELQLGFVFAASVFVAVQRSNSRLHFANEQVVLLVAPARFHHHFLGAKRHVLRHYVFAVEC